MCDTHTHTLNEWKCNKKLKKYKPTNSLLLKKWLHTTGILFHFVNSSHTDS